MVAISARIGTFVRVKVSDVSKEAAISGSAAFFAPPIGITPSSGTPPRIQILSIASFTLTPRAQTLTSRQLELTAFGRACTGERGGAQDTGVAPVPRHFPSCVIWRSSWARACSLRRRRFSRRALASRSSRAARSRLLRDVSDESLSIHQCYRRGTATVEPHLRVYQTPTGGRAGRLTLPTVVSSCICFQSQWGSAQTGRCRSSVVEHSLGKGEVESSILSGSTIFLNLR